MSISADLIYNLKQWADDYSIEELLQMTADDLGKLLRLNARLGEVALTAARQFPRLEVEPKLQPLSSDLLRVVCKVKPVFKWNDKLHGRTEYFWIWLSDAEDREILQISKVGVKENTSSIPVEFNIQLADKPELLHVRIISDSWLGSESTTPIELSNLVLPPAAPPKRKILELPFSPTQLDERLLELLLSRNTVQSAIEVQCLHSLFFTCANVLVAAPVSRARDHLMTVPTWCVPSHMIKS